MDIISVTDENGNETNFKYNEFGNLEDISANEFSVKEEESGTVQTNIIEGKDGMKSTSSIKYTADGNYIYIFQWNHVFIKTVWLQRR